MIVTIYDSYGRVVPSGTALGVTAPPLWTSHDMLLVPTGNVGYNQYNHSSRPISCITASSGTASLQTFTMRFAWRPIPPGFAEFRTTGALVLGMIGDSNSTSDVKFTALALYGSDLTSGSETTLYSDATARTPSAANAVEEISINTSAFSVTTVPEFISVELTGQVANSKKLGILWAGVFDQ